MLRARRVEHCADRLETAYSLFFGALQNLGLSMILAQYMCCTILCCYGDDIITFNCNKIMYISSSDVSCKYILSCSVRSREETH